MKIPETLKDPKVHIFIAFLLGTHMVWLNIQRKYVPLNERTEYKFYLNIRKKLGFSVPEIEKK